MKSRKGETKRRCGYRKSRSTYRKRCGYRKGRKTQRGGDGIFAFLEKFNPFSTEKKEEGIINPSVPSTEIHRTLPPASATQSMTQPMTGGKRKHKKRSVKRSTKRQH